jgi:hypothetical protein
VTFVHVRIVSPEIFEPLCEIELATASSPHLVVVQVDPGYDNNRNVAGILC